MPEVHGAHRAKHINPWPPLMPYMVSTGPTQNPWIPHIPYIWCPEGPTHQSLTPFHALHGVHTGHFNKPLSPLMLYMVSTGPGPNTWTPKTLLCPAWCPQGLIQKPVTLSHALHGINRANHTNPDPLPCPTWCPHSLILESLTPSPVLHGVHTA